MYLFTVLTIKAKLAIQINDTKKSYKKSDTSNNVAFINQ